MKAVYLTGIRHFEIKEKPGLVLKSEDDVLINIKTVSVCGSDIHYYKHGRIGGQKINFPFIIGHECSGIIESVGKNVKKLKKGDKVAIDPAVSCFKCDQCLAGRPHTCRDLKFLGCPGELEGAMQEFIIMPEKSCYKVSDETNFIEAALTEPLSVGIYAVKQAGINKGCNIGIFGFGPIGMSVLLAAKINGKNKFFVVDKINERLAIAKKEGVKLAVNFNNNATYKQILTIEKDGLDIVFECCGQQEAVDEAINVLKPGGKLVIVGIPEFDNWQFDSSLIRRKEITVINVRRQNDCTREAINYIEKKIISVERMPTHIFDIKEVNVAFNWVENYRDGIMKAVINL